MTSMANARVSTSVTCNYFDLHTFLALMMFCVYCALVELNFELLCILAELRTAVFSKVALRTIRSVSRKV